MEENLTQVQILAEDCATTPAWSLSDGELVACIQAVFRALQQLTAVLLHLIREADGRNLPGLHGASSGGVWLRELLRVSIRTGRQWINLARVLDQRPALDAALAGGTVNVEQAQVIAAAIADLPEEAGIENTDEAEATLIGYANQFEPTALGKMGTRILAHVAPQIAEAAEAKKLAEEEKRAHKARAFTLTPTHDGRVRVSGWLEREAAAIVNAALDPLCSPARGDELDMRSPAQRRADALAEVCDLALRTTQLPENGGDRPQVVVTVPFDVLSRQLGAGMLDTGEPLSPTQVRRLACDAMVIPAVLGGDGQVLDLGQARRLFTGPVRRALVLRDGGCAFPGCDRPPRWCEGHHIKGVLDGGPTDVDNGVLLCKFHHGVIHRGDWIVRMGRDQRPEFIPPAFIDPERRPRRNTYHRRPLAVHIG
jgi:hypothetical protein